MHSFTLHADTKYSLTLNPSLPPSRIIPLSFDSPQPSLNSSAAHNPFKSTIKDIGRHLLWSTGDISTVNALLAAAKIHPKSIACLNGSHNGSFVIGCLSNGKLFVLSQKSCQRLPSPDLHGLPKSLYISNDGIRILVIHSDNAISYFYKRNETEQDYVGEWRSIKTTIPENAVIDATFLRQSITIVYLQKSSKGLILSKVVAATEPMEAERELLTISTTIHQRSWYCLLDDICETPAFDNMGWNDIQFEEIYNRDGILKTAERFHPLFEKSCVLNVDLTGKVVGIALNDSFVHKSLFLLIKFEPKIHAHSVRVGKILAQKCGLHEKSIDPSLDIASFSFISLHSSSYPSSVTLITSRGQLLFITRCGQLMQFMPVHSSSSTAASTPEDKITQVWQLPILDCVRRHAEKEHGTFFERLLTPSITADQQIFRVAVRVGKQSSGSTPLSNKSDNRLVKLLCSDGFVVTELHFTTNENELVHPMKNDVADNVSDVKKNLYLLTQQLSFALTSPFDTSPADLELVNIINTYLRDVANLTSVCTFTECLDQICIQFMYTTDPAKLGTLFPLMTFKLLRTFCDDRNLVFAFHLVSNVGDWLNRFTELRELYPKSNFSRTPNRKGVKERITWELGWMYLYSRFHRQLSANNTRKSKEWNDLIKSVMTKVEAIGVEKGYLKTFNDELMKAHIHYITCFESRPDALSIEATALYKSHIIQHKSATALPCLLSGLIQHYDLDFILSFIRYLVGVDDIENFVQWFPHLNFTQLYLNSTNNPWNWLDPCVITNCSMGPSETESTAVESRRSLDDVRELVLDFWKELIALNSSSASRSFEQSESRIRIPSPIDLALLVYLNSEGLNKRATELKNSYGDVLKPEALIAWTLQMGFVQKAVDWLEEWGDWMNQLFLLMCFGGTVALNGTFFKDGTCREDNSQLVSLIRKISHISLQDRQLNILKFIVCMMDGDDGVFDDLRIELLDTIIDQMKTELINLPLTLDHDFNLSIVDLDTSNHLRIFQTRSTASHSHQENRARSNLFTLFEMFIIIAGSAGHTILNDLLQSSYEHINERQRRRYSSLKSPLSANSLLSPSRSIWPQPTLRMNSHLQGPVTSICRLLWFLELRRQLYESTHPVPAEGRMDQNEVTAIVMKLLRFEDLCDTGALVKLAINAMADYEVNVGLEILQKHSRHFSLEMLNRVKSSYVEYMSLRPFGSNSIHLNDAERGKIKTESSFSSNIDTSVQSFFMDSKFSEFLGTVVDSVSSFSPQKTQSCQKWKYGTLNLHSKIESISTRMYKLREEFKIVQQDASDRRKARKYMQGLIPTGLLLQAADKTLLLQDSEEKISVGDGQKTAIEETKVCESAAGAKNKEDRSPKTLSCSTATVENDVGDFIKNAVNSRGQTPEASIEMTETKPDAIKVPILLPRDSKLTVSSTFTQTENAVTLVAQRQFLESTNSNDGPALTPIDLPSPSSPLTYPIDDSPAYAYISRNVFQSTVESFLSETRDLLRQRSDVVQKENDASISRWEKARAKSDFTEEQIREGRRMEIEKSKRELHTQLRGKVQMRLSSKSPRMNTAASGTVIKLLVANPPPRTTATGMRELRLLELQR